MDHWRCSFLPVCCTCFMWCAAEVSVMCGCVCAADRCKHAYIWKWTGRCMHMYATFSFSTHFDNIHKLLWDISSGCSKVLCKFKCLWREAATSAVGYYVLNQTPLWFPWNLSYHKVSIATCASACVSLCVCVWESSRIKVSNHPSSSAAGGERCLCFLINLLRKKPLALSHVPLFLKIIWHIQLCWFNS